VRLVTNLTWKCAALAFVAVLGAWARGSLVCAPLPTSDDVHRYVHEGRLAQHHLALPYWLPPAALTPVADDGETALVNHKTIKAAYWPGVTLGFAGLTAIADGAGIRPVQLWRLCLLCIDMVVVVWLWRVCGRGAAALWWLHPLWWIEAISAVHIDAAGAALMMMCLLAVRQQRAVWAAIALGMAIHAKPIALLWLLAGPRQVRVGAVVVALCLWVPHLAVHGPLMPPGLLAYAEHWEASPLLYRALEWPWRGLFEARAAANIYAHLWVDAHGVVVEQAGHAWLTWGAPHADAHRLLLDHRVIAKGASLCLWALSVVCSTRVARTIDDDTERFAWVGLVGVGAWLLLTPTLHPWYALWLLPSLVALLHHQKRVVRMVWWLCLVISVGVLVLYA
jgi:hypothetical protein